MSSGTWRGTVGVVKPAYGSGSLVEFIRLLPEGVGCIPMYAGIKDNSGRGHAGRLAKYKIPIFTSGMSQAEALRALGIKKFVGCTYFRDKQLNDIFTRYFEDSGF